MSDSTFFIGVAQQYGFSEGAAREALLVVEGRLAERGITARRLLCFRSEGGGGAGEHGETQPPARPRLLLAFQSADDALSFAQRSGLGRAPRLVAISLEQALVALIQRPALGYLLIANHDDTAGRGLPDGLRIERSSLLELLAGVTP
jgi:hypothetical protein